MQNTVKDNLSIYTTPYFMKYFEMEKLKAKVIALPLQKMGRAFLENGKENDICIMPFFSNCVKIIEMLRISRCSGTVIVITHKSAEPEIAGQLPGLGAILIDMRYERTDFIQILLRYFTENRFSIRKNILKHSVLPSQDDKKEKKETKNPAAVAARLRSLLKERFGSSEQLSLLAVLKRQDLSAIDFSFSFKTESHTQILELPVYCMAKVSHAHEETEPIPHSLLIFKNIYPEFGLSLLKKIAVETSPEDLKQALASAEYGKTLSNIVQFELETDGIPRTCIIFFYRFYIILYKNI